MLSPDGSSLNKVQSTFIVFLSALNYPNFQINQRSPKSLLKKPNSMKPFVLQFAKSISHLNGNRHAKTLRNGSFVMDLSLRMLKFEHMVGKNSKLMAKPCLLGMAKLKQVTFLRHYHNPVRAESFVSQLAGSSRTRAPVQWITKLPDETPHTYFLRSYTMAREQNLPLAARRGSGSPLGIRGGKIDEKQSGKWSPHGVPPEWSPELLMSFLHEQGFASLRNMQPPRYKNGVWTVCCPTSWRKARIHSFKKFQKAVKLSMWDHKFADVNLSAILRGHAVDIFFRIASNRLVCLYHQCAKRLFVPQQWNHHKRFKNTILKYADWIGWKASANWTFQNPFVRKNLKFVVPERISWNF